MTSEELKEKIASIIETAFNNRCHKTNCQDCDLYPDEMCQPNMYADALIAAGIGFMDDVALRNQVKEAEHHAKVAEDELARHKRALIIAGDKFINEVCNMRGEDISDKCDYKCDTCFYEYYIQQAEKELEEEERKDENN